MRRVITTFWGTSSEIAEWLYRGTDARRKTDSERRVVPECMINKREMGDTLSSMRSPHMLDGAYACFLVECARANSITRPENGEESFETLGFEKNFVRTISDITQISLDRRADSKEQRRLFYTGEYFDEKKRERHIRSNIIFTREKKLAWHFATNDHRFHDIMHEFYRIAQTF